MTKLAEPKRKRYARVFQNPGDKNYKILKFPDKDTLNAFLAEDPERRQRAGALEKDIRRVNRTIENGTGEWVSCEGHEEYKSHGTV